MSDEKRCAQCGAVLAAGALQGLCPACLLKRGFATGSSVGASNQGARTEYVPPTPAELARYFPELEILELIGRGGMGAVYKARQKSLDRLVALKILPFSVNRDPAFAERFAREARALARLAHPNIVNVHDFGQADGLYYFVMEFVDGLNLRQLLNSGKIAPKEALAIVPQICDALQYAHDKGIVHRDIKPENILIDKTGTVKIADFGLAKLVSVEAKDLRITGSGDVMGTPHYMAPEQVEHPQDVDHRADIYSLGVVFYQMLTGELPIGRFAPPSKKVVIDVRLDEVILRALEKEPELRYQQASVLKTEVETIVGTPPSSSRSEESKAGKKGYDFRTRQALFGLPLIHVAWGYNPVTGLPRTAKGILAVGPTAIGVVAVGIRAVGLLSSGIFSGGVISVGLLSVGLMTTGLISAGLQAVGLLSLAFGHAVGLVAAGAKPIGLEQIVFSENMTGLIFALVVAFNYLSSRLVWAMTRKVATPDGASGPAATQWCLCCISSPEHLRSFYGSLIYLYEGKGRLHLDAGELTYSDHKNSLRIPLHSIRDLHIGHYSRLAKPAGLDYISITYAVEGNTRTRLFTPCSSPLTPTWKTNRLVAEWFYAIQTAVRKAQGETIVGNAGVSPAATPTIEALKDAALSAPKTPQVKNETGGRLGGIVLVGSCNGRRVINWSGVICAGAIIYGAILAGLIVAFGRYVPLHSLIASTVGVATLVTAALVKAGLKLPMERLAPFDPSASRNWGTSFPGRSLQEREICTHLTAAEKNKMGWLMLLFLPESMVLFFVLIAFVYNFKHRMDDIAFTCAFVFLIALLLGWLCLWSWKSRQFLCSTAWAKKQGLTPDRLRMFSFGGAESQHSGTARAKSDGPPRFSRAAKKPASGSGGSNAVPPGQTVHSGGAWKIVTVIVAAVMLLLAIPVGFLLLTYENLRVVRNQSISDCVVHGIVTDAVTGKPIPGARVDDNHYGAGPNRTPQQAWTDANGHYELKTWPEEHSIAASAPGYESKLATLKTTLFGRERIARMDFQLRPTHAAEAPQFGPVIEEVLKAPDRRVAELLDLDTGQRATSTNFGENDRETHAWIREHELDVLGVVEKGQIAVLCMDMAVAPTTSNRWDAITPSEGVTNWGLNQQEPKPITGISPVTDNTDTWFFRTREGGMGILQIIGSTDNPRGVKIRYKLVQNGKQNTSTTSAAEQNANQEIARLKLQHAEQEVKEAEAKVSIGLMAEYDLQKAKWSRDIAAAELKGDNVGVARLKLAIAESDLDAAGKEFSVGKATSQEYEQAKLARDTEMVRYKLVQDATNRLPVTLFEPADTPAQLAEPPKLRFLTWQDEWKTNQPGAARHPDGSPVTDAAELDWLRQVHPGGMDVSKLNLNPEPRFLHLWFSHPLFGQTSLNELTLLDDKGEPIALGANGSMAGGAQNASELNGNLGWLTHTLSPSTGTSIPTRVTVRLRYTVGPLEKTQEVAVTPNTHTSMSLEGNSELNGVGQNADGNAFVSIAVNAQNMKSRQFGVIAVTKEGRELESSGGGTSGNVDSWVSVASFEFAAPLADIARFRIGTRPIRTMEWKDVVLPGSTAPVAAVEANKLPKLDGESAKGLRLECLPGRETFTVGEKVWINCCVTNTTPETKPVAWTIGTGNNFSLYPVEEPRSGGSLPVYLLPVPFPRLNESLVVKDGYPPVTQKILYLPPGQSVDFVLDCGYYAKPQKVGGRIVYDPLSPRNGWWGTPATSTNQATQRPWANQLIASEAFVFEVVGETNAVAQNLSFGPATNSLQAALELTTSNGVFALNEPITVRFHIRNVSKTNIVIAGSSDRQDTGEAITIRDEQGRRVFPVNHIWYSGDPVIQRKILEPGQTATFRSTDLEFLFDDDRYGKVHWRAGDYFKVKPGRYTVCYRLRFPNFTRKSAMPSRDVPQPSDWQGTLETAPVTIEVKDIGIPLPVSRNEKISGQPARGELRIRRSAVGNCTFLDWHPPCSHERMERCGAARKLDVYTLMEAHFILGLIQHSNARA